MDKDLLNKCRELVRNNAKENLNEEVYEILTYATLGIILTNGEIAVEKLPEILQDLNIYAEKKPIIEIAHEKLGNYHEDNLLSTSNACVTRSLVIEDNKTITDEKRSLLIQLKDTNNFFKLVFTVMHELSHLLRFGGIINKEDEYKILDGIGVSRFNIKDLKVKRKYKNLEEGIVQRNANIAAKNLFEFLTELKDNNENSKKYIKEYKRYKFDDYFLEVSIIENLCANEEFKKIVDESFTDINIPSGLSIYFNKIMESSSTFTELNKLLDKASEYVRSNERNELLIATTLLEIKKICIAFHQNAKKYKH